MGILSAGAKVPARFAAAALALCAFLLAPLRAEEGSTAQVLSERGLTRLEGVWLLPQEVELRGLLGQLPKRRDRLAAVERELEAQIEQNALAWQANQSVLATLRQTLGKLPTDDPGRPALARQIETLAAAAPEPARLGATDRLRPRLIAWSAERHEQIAGIARVRLLLSQLGDAYAAAAQDPAIAAALQKAASKHRLGPHRSYRSDAEKLSNFERQVHTPWVPVHWQAGKVRLAGLIDDRSPITFTYHEGSAQPTLLTASAAAAARLSVPDDAPREVISLSNDRQVKAREIKLAYLRFGGCVLRDVTALVLPPEAEDWGNRIGREAFVGYSVRLEPERFRMWIEGGQ